MLGDSPRSGMCAPERAEFIHAQAFIMCVCIDACLYVYLSELLLRDSPRSGMCAPERAVAWSLSTFRHVVLCTYLHASTCMHYLSDVCSNL